jgi:CDP-diacylglycerol--serine O-phosphatidyltransferase
MKKHIPNFITSLNLASGFIASIYALNGNLAAASWIILAAMIFDFLDGLSARILKAYSDLGKELDSLADIVSFGVAPALIICQLIENSLSPDVSSIVLFSPVIMPVCAALRLAKFNIDETQSKSFKGLPTPANALAVISVVIAARYSESGILTNFTGSVIGLIIFTAILSMLMITRLPLLSLKTTHIKLKGNEGRYILILMVITAFALIGVKAAPLIIPFYIIISLLSLLFNKSTG